MNRICVGISAAYAQGGLPTDPILHFGSEGLKRPYLPPAVRGEKIAAFATDRTGCRIRCCWDPDTAVKHGDGYRITGSKTYISNGTICDFLTVLPIPILRRGYGESVYLLWSVRTRVFCDEKLEKLGNHSSDTAELALTMLCPRRRE